MKFNLDYTCIATYKATRAATIRAHLSSPTILGGFRGAHFLVFYVVFLFLSSSAVLRALCCPFL